MDNGIFDAQALAAEIRSRARRVIELQEVPMERVSASDDLVDLLITDRLAEDGKSPKQLGASTHQKPSKASNVLVISATARKAGVARVTVHIQHQHRIVAAAFRYSPDFHKIAAVTLQV
jgi:hypothetical protein